MKVLLVDKRTGDERGWIEFGGRTFHICCQMLEDIQQVVTLFTYCGIPHIPQEPPERIEIEE